MSPKSNFTTILTPALTLTLPKTFLIDKLLNSNNSSELIKICTDEVNEKIKKRENFVGDNI